MEENTLKKYNRRFVIRDMETKEALKRGSLVQEFNSINSAKNVFVSLHFGLVTQYEIYDTKHNKIVRVGNVGSRKP